jgi:hypothetical protein
VCQGRESFPFFHHRESKKSETYIERQRTHAVIHITRYICKAGENINRSRIDYSLESEQLKPFSDSILTVFEMKFHSQIIYIETNIQELF